MTAALWIRGFLQHDFGIHARDMRWRSGAMDERGYDERLALDLPADIEHETVAEGETLEGMLENGSIDGLIMAARPNLTGGGNVRRLFPDFPAVEKDYYRRTGLFPIMHTVVIRRAVYETHPWIATSLFEAFERAKQAGRERIRVTGPLAVALPWLPAHLEEINEVFGGSDPWVYGIEPNRGVLRPPSPIRSNRGWRRGPYPWKSSLPARPSSPRPSAASPEPIHSSENSSDRSWPFTRNFPAPVNSTSKMWAAQCHPRSLRRAQS